MIIVQKTPPQGTLNQKQSTYPERHQTKPGLKLSKTNEECPIANEYSKCIFDLSKKIMDVNYKQKILQDNAYNYFKQTYGTVNNSDDDNTATLEKDAIIYRKDNQENNQCF